MLERLFNMRILRVEQQDPYNPNVGHMKQRIDSFFLLVSLVLFFFWLKCCYFLVSRRRLCLFKLGGLTSDRGAADCWLKLLHLLFFFLPLSFALFLLRSTLIVSLALTIPLLFSSSTASHFYFSHLKVGRWQRKAGVV